MKSQIIGSTDAPVETVAFSDLAFVGALQTAVAAEAAAKQHAAAAVAAEKIG